MTAAESSDWHISCIRTVCKSWSSVPDHQQRLGIYYFRNGSQRSNSITWQQQQCPREPAAAQCRTQACVLQH